VLLARHLLVVAAEDVEDVLPALPLVGDQRLEQGERSVPVSGALVLELAQSLRDAGEPGPLAEEAADLEVGAHALVEASE
jgi:hypothetical protein